MDTELARTFLTVVAAGSFVAASERLHVTQSTVSARIQALEDLLGCKLFVRNKAGTTLTPPGQQFQKHASTLVRTVEQARHDVGVPRGFRASLAIGGRFGLWEHLLLRWLPVMRQKMPDVSLRAEVGFEADLMQGLQEGRVDIAVMYTPQSRPGLKVDLLLEEELVFVGTRTFENSQPDQDYVYIDWGPEFYARHNAIFPNFVGPAITANIGWLGLQHVLDHGGSGYFPLRLIRPYLDDGRLVRSDDTPSFSLPAFVAYPADSDPDLMAMSLSIMHDLASQ